MHTIGNTFPRWAALVAAIPFATIAHAATLGKANSQEAQTLSVSVPDGVVQVQIWTDSIVRVTYRNHAASPYVASLSVIAKPSSVKLQRSETPEAFELRTRLLEVRVERQSGHVSFLDLRGKPILEEAATTRLAGPAPQLSFVLGTGEGIYGLGQHEEGGMNYRGKTIHLQQVNRSIAVPFLVSSRGYGVLWDNPAVTDVSVNDQLTWKSEAGDAVDYYFVYGPTSDEVVRGYRTLTGQAPLMAKWLFGLWQCKEHYASQDELLSIARKYRELKVPIDGIIQDWQYWKSGQWGAHDFDPARYPDPSAMVKQLHDLNFHTLLSVWSRFDEGTDSAKALDQAHALYPALYPNVYPQGFGRWYDAFNPVGRDIYWNLMAKKLAPMGWDGWWLDATEPELGGNWGQLREVPTALGIGAKVFNAYPLMTTTGVYEGQRKRTDKKRVAILTRSAYAGQQRNSAISWSGDIGGDWKTFAGQIPAGLNFSISGIPYWNTDIGGFFGHDPNDPKYQELFRRWFQYGAFCPMFRVHGVPPGKEYWKWDDTTQKSWMRFVRLRYRLLPYIYSVSWQITHEGGTMMRPLVMDFADDAKALSIPDQFLFGPSLMVSPVVTEGALSRSVYLPGDKPWTDFWSGKRFDSAQTVVAEAPADRLPLLVRAGSILPLGPELQYASEKPADPIELRVYAGADGSFSLYEDEGDGYAYEKGACATIPIQWKDATGTLTLGKRKGEFPGMLANRSFRVVLVKEGHGVDVDETSLPEKVVSYSGKTISVKLGSK